MDIQFFEIFGMIETVTTVPTKTPTKLNQQIKIYVDSITTPSDKRLYIYSNKTHTWMYCALT
jgi:hypothetical protein